MRRNTMIRFDDLEFKIEQYTNIARARVDYKLYSLSIILEAGKNHYECAIQDDNRQFVQLPGINDKDVIPGLTVKNVNGIMTKLSSITCHPGVAIQ